MQLISYVPWGTQQNSNSRYKHVGMFNELKIYKLIHNVINYWGSGLLPQPAILNIRNHNILGTGSASFVR
jgi:hypothetical protein